MLQPDSIFHHVGSLVSWTAATQFVSYVVSGAISSMEAPNQNSSMSYRFWFKYLNWLAANWKRSGVTKYQMEDGTSISQVPTSKPSTDAVISVPKDTVKVNGE